MLPSDVRPGMRMPEIPFWVIALIGLGPIGLAVVLGLGWVGIRSCQESPLKIGSATAVPAVSQLPLSGTTKVVLEAPGALIIKLGEPEVLSTDATPATLARLTTDVRGDRLVIGSRGSLLANPKFYLTVKRLEGITIVGSGDVVAPDLKGDSVQLTLAGSGDLVAGSIEAQRVRLRLTSTGDAVIRGVRARSLDVVTAGSADVRIGAGQVDEQRVVVNGSGDYEARQLLSGRTTAVINGSSELALWARDSLGVTINGSGRVAYRGHPALRQRIAGSGSVQSLGD